MPPLHALHTFTGLLLCTGIQVRSHLAHRSHLSHDYVQYWNGRTHITACHVIGKWYETLQFCHQCRAHGLKFATKVRTVRAMLLYNSLVLCTGRRKRGQCLHTHNYTHKVPQAPMYLLPHPQCYTGTPPTSPPTKHYKLHHLPPDRMSVAPAAMHRRAWSMDTELRFVSVIMRNLIRSGYTTSVDQGPAQAYLNLCFGLASYAILWHTAFE